MRTWLSVSAVVVLAAVGCNKSPEGGTPGTSSSFKISAPTMATGIKQDNSQTVKITLDRGKDFKQTVKLKAEPSSDKIKAEFVKDTVAAADPAEASLKLTVAKDAPVGKYTVKVTGTPEGGTATAVDLEVNVETP